MPVAASERICAACGHVGLPQIERRGRPLLGASLWMATFVLFFVGILHWTIALLALLGLLVAGGYSIWRSVGSIRVCAQCGTPHTLVVGSPEGRQVREKHQEASRRAARRSPPR